MLSNIVLPLVSLVMFKDSRIGTPLATRVPSVRQVRATMFFSMIMPKIGIFSLKRSHPSRPYLNWQVILIRSQTAIGMAGIKNHQRAVLLEMKISIWVMPGSSTLELLEDLFERRHDLDHDEGQDADGYAHDHHRVDHRPLDLFLQRLGLLQEVGQALEDDLQRAAGLAGLDHVHVQAVEGLGLPGHRLGERVARLDVFADVDERVLERAGLGLVLQDAQAAEDRQAGVLENGKLAREGREDLGADAADGEGLFLLPLAAGALLGLGFLDAELGDEIAHRPDRRLRFFFVGRLDDVLQLVALGIHRLVLVGRHCRSLAENRRI